MKLNIGDYIRILTMSGESRIAKLEKIDNICITDNGAVDINNIIKSSSNIIDLIEEGDYVNGYDVEYVDYKDKMIICYGATLDEEDIKSIVTKEQFEQMEYKIGDDNE